MKSSISIYLAPFSSILELDFFSGYILNHEFTFFLKVILYATGLLLFFATLRPFKKVAIYFSSYAISILSIGLFYLFGCVFLAILSSLSLLPISPKHLEYQTDTIKIYDTFEGFLSSCCSYEVVEQKLYIFEKHLGYFNIEKPIDAGKDKFVYKNGKLFYRQKLNIYGHSETRDTIEILNLE